MEIIYIPYLTIFFHKIQYLFSKKSNKLIVPFRPVSTTPVKFAAERGERGRRGGIAIAKKQTEAKSRRK